MKLKTEKTQNKRPFDAILFAATVPARQPIAKDKADAKEHKDDLVEAQNERAMEPGYKSKIGSHLSYPVKLSELCKALSYTAEQPNVRIFFTAYKAPRKNETRSLYAILEASYNPGLPFAQHFAAESWQIQVEPVPRSLRKEVQAQLLPALESRLRDWLQIKRHQGWYAKYHALRLRYDTIAKEIKCNEYNSP